MARIGRWPRPEEEGKDSFYDDPRVRRLYEQAEQVIQDAVSPEKMKNNPYHGKPLDLKSNPHEGSYGLAFRMLKSSGFKLPWMEMRDEIGAEKEALHALTRQFTERLEAQGSRLEAQPHKRAFIRAEVVADQRQFHAELEERVNALRRRIAQFNLEVPVLHQQLINVRVEQFLNPYKERIDAAMARLAGDEDSV